VTFAYHRMFRILPTYRWWKPLIAILVGGALYYGFTLVYQFIVLGIVGAAGGRQAELDLIHAQAQDQQNASNPLVMLLTLGSLATMLPAVLLAVRIARLGPVGQLASVRGRLRWRWLVRLLIPGIIYMAITIGLGLIVPASWQGDSSGGSGQATPPLALTVSIVLIVLLVPLQAAGEEFAFRGLGMQTLGSWFRWPIIAIVVPTVGFAFAHNYNVWGKLDVAALGVSFAYLTWRTGGLEAGLVAHVINNVVVFILAAPIVTSTESNGSPIGAAITVVASAVYVLLVTYLARKHEPERVAPPSGAGSLGEVIHNPTSPGPRVGGAS
jgi:membrane protease YdiL (CAAX protease family)